MFDKRNLSAVAAFIFFIAFFTVQGGVLGSNANQGENTTKDRRFPTTSIAYQVEFSEDEFVAALPRFASFAKKHGFELIKSDSLTDSRFRLAAHDLWMNNTKGSGLFNYGVYIIQIIDQGIIRVSFINEGFINSEAMLHTAEEFLRVFVSGLDKTHSDISSRYRRE